MLQESRVAMACLHVITVCSVLPINGSATVLDNAGITVTKQDVVRLNIDRSVFH